VAHEADEAVDADCTLVARRAPMTIEIREEYDADRIDAATLPPFRNGVRCPTCRRVWAIRVHYCPGCPKIAGAHFHRLCPCGAMWDERT
jgi:hypothetical protein